MASRAQSYDDYVGAVQDAARGARGAHDFYTGRPGGQHASGTSHAPSFDREYPQRHGVASFGGRHHAQDQQGRYDSGGRRVMHQTQAPYQGQHASAGGPPLGYPGPGVGAAAELLRNRDGTYGGRAARDPRNRMSGSARSSSSISLSAASNGVSSPRYGQLDAYLGSISTGHPHPSGGAGGFRGSPSSSVRPMNSHRRNRDSGYGADAPPSALAQGLSRQGSTSSIQRYAADMSYDGHPGVFFPGTPRRLDSQAVEALFQRSHPGTYDTAFDSGYGSD